MKKDRWIDSLEISEGGQAHDYRFSALQWLVEALHWAEVGDQPKLLGIALNRAGGSVVGWRKSLDDQGERRVDQCIGNAPIDAWIAACIRSLIFRDTSVTDLRYVEAVLRSIWREGERRR